MRVLVAMSGGVDSSVAAALLVERGFDVVGATLRLWGGESDSGCCSVGDVEDARRVAARLGIVHHVFNLAEAFEEHVVAPYVADHAAARTPNPCIECNRHIKFDRLLARAGRLGFDALATGHHARVEPGERGRWRLRRGRDASKDQSYVLSMLGQDALRRVRLPVGELTKAEVRSKARALGLHTADKPDSVEVCFVTRDDGRGGFLGRRIALRPGRLVETPAGPSVGQVPALELVTVGQRRGLGAGPEGQRRYALGVDPFRGEILVGPREELDVDSLPIGSPTWVDEPLPDGTGVLVQSSAHGGVAEATLDGTAPAGSTLHFARPSRRVAPGQTVALYSAADPELVVGSAVVR